MRKVAIFVDAGFFNRFFLPVIDPDMNCPASELAKKMWHYWIKHVNRSAGESLYRIFYYDCPPLENIAHHPITNRQIDFSKSDITRYMQALHAELFFKYGSDIGTLTAVKSNTTTNTADFETVPLAAHLLGKNNPLPFFCIKLDVHIS